MIIHKFASLRAVCQIQVGEPFMTEVLYEYADIRNVVKLIYKRHSSTTFNEIGHDFTQKLVSAKLLYAAHKTTFGKK